ncbi:MAG: N-acetyltransferase family protein [Sedimentitalea sp.]
MILRAAKPDDSVEICAIQNAMIQNTEATFTTQLRDADSFVADITARGDAFQVAESNEKIIGFASYGPFRGGPGYAHTREHSVQIADQARGQGVGSALMERLEQVARDSGVHVLVAGISSANPASIRFHSRLGFTVVATMPEVGRKNGKWLDLILMQKRLITPDSAAPIG